MTKKAATAGKTKKTSAFGKSFDRVVHIGIVVLIALIAIVTYNADAIKAVIARHNTATHHQSEAMDSQSAPQATQEKPKQRSNATFPNYDEYVAMSIEKNWSPSDPLEKLNATIQKYSQVCFGLC